jgi:methionyl aminopeptidase
MSWARQIHIKNPAELQIMREAGRINATVHATVKELLKPGVSTAELNAAAEDVLRKHGCVSPFKGYGHPPFPSSITTSINQELVHGIPSRKSTLKPRHCFDRLWNCVDGWAADLHSLPGWRNLTRSAGTA